MMHILIVDDESLARARMRTLLNECDPVFHQNLHDAANVEQALKVLKHHPIDLVLLDIHLPNQSGFDLMKHVRQLPIQPAVIFVTAHAEHAVEAFEVEAVDYLTKPVRVQRLQQALQKAVRHLHHQRQNQSQNQQHPPPESDSDKNPDVIIIQDRHRVERVALKDVLYFKAELKYITLRTVAHTYVIEGALNEYEERYKSQFLRVHRNALVRRSAIRALEKQYASSEYEGWMIKLQGVTDTLQVSRRQIAAVRNALAQAS